MTIIEILEFLDKNEIDYRLESNFCCGYIFYFLDGSIYPRRYHDYALEGIEETIFIETTESMIMRTESSIALQKDWKYRIEGGDLSDTFKQVEAYLKDNYKMI